MDVNLNSWISVLYFGIFLIMDVLWEVGVVYISKFLRKFTLHSTTMVTVGIVTAWFWYLAYLLVFLSLKLVIYIEEKTSALEIFFKFF